MIIVCSEIINQEKEMNLIPVCVVGDHLSSLIHNAMDAKRIFLIGFLSNKKLLVGIWLHLQILQSGNIIF